MPLVYRNIFKLGEIRAFLHNFKLEIVMFLGYNIYEYENKEVGIECNQKELFQKL